MKPRGRALLLVTGLMVSGLSYVAGAPPAGADLYNCSGAIGLTNYTKSICHSTTGSGIQRAKHTCSSGGHGSNQYGSWTGVDVYSTAGYCGGTISNRAQQFA